LSAVTATPALPPSPFVAFIEDDPLVVRTIKLIVRPPKLRIARSVVEAKPLVLLPECRGILIDFGLPDGCGTNVVEHAQSHGRRLPTMFLTGRADHAASCEVARLGALFVLKPPSKQILQGFVDTALSSEPGHRAILDDISRAWAERYQTTPTESELLHAIIHGASRSDLDNDGARADATTKVHLRNLRKKTGDKDIDELRRRAAHEALQLCFANRGFVMPRHPRR
jgi:FixJ family two-component response regulator